MECAYIHDYVFAYLENELPAGERAEFANHLHSCTACRSFMVIMESIEKVIDSERSLEPEPFHETRLLEYLEPVMNPHRSVVGWKLQVAGIIAGIVLAISTGITIGMIGGSKYPKENKTDLMMSSMKSSLFITDFVDDDKTFFSEK